MAETHSGVVSALSSAKPPHWPNLWITDSPDVFSTSEMVYFMKFNVDGGCRRNGQSDAIGVAACCLHFAYGKRHMGKTCRLDSFPAPTSQRAEITAIILALEWALERYGELAGCPRLAVTIRSDSQYAVNCMTEWIYNWARKGWTNSRGFEVANRDLIERASDLDDRVSALGSVDYIWVPRLENRDADALCQQELDEQESSYGSLKLF